MRRNSMFFKYMASSFFSWLVDLGLFSLVVWLLRDTGGVYYISIATVFSRSFSSSLNYLLNKKFVFKNKDSLFKTFGKYIFLFLLRLFFSATIITSVFVRTGFNESTIKVAVDMVLFVIGYILQRKWVFKK